MSFSGAKGVIQADYVEVCLIVDCGGCRLIDDIVPENPLCRLEAFAGLQCPNMLSLSLGWGPHKECEEEDEHCTNGNALNRGVNTLHRLHHDCDLR